MGCVSSRIITKSASFCDDWNRLSFRRKGDETIISKKGSSQFVALLCSANKVAGRLEQGSHEPPAADANKEYSSNPLEHTSSYSTDTKDFDVDIETVNTKGHGERSVAPERSITVIDLLGPSRRIPTIEDFDATMAAKQSQAEDINKCELDRVVELENKCSATDTHEKGSRRKAMAKDLAALKVPSFEFSRAGSLKDWLVLGGQQVPSPGSYVTPKFGSFAAQDGPDNVPVFHPELVWQFEPAMEHFAIEEDCILEKIIEGRESGLLI